ncbi:MAG: MarR family winged helix-turn-helix transcriptional regulator [Sedimentitalea sp.]
MTTPDPNAPLLDETAFDQNLNIRILRLASSLSTLFQRSTLRKKNVTIQEYRILVSIARHGGGHVRALSRKASMDPAHASRTMKAMHEKGWLTRNPDRNDKRLAIFTMTQAGQSLFMSIFPAADALAKELSDLFSDDEARQLRDMLDRAREHAAALLDATEN